MTRTQLRTTLQHNQEPRYENRSTNLVHGGGTGRLSKITYATGAITTFAYNTAGKLITLTGTRQATSYEYDASNCNEPKMKFGARYYDPITGRFTQRDPSGQDPHYTYAANNPINNSDPTGLVCYSFNKDSPECGYYGPPAPQTSAACRRGAALTGLSLILGPPTGPLGWTFVGLSTSILIAGCFGY